MVKNCCIHENAKKFFTEPEEIPMEKSNFLDELICETLDVFFLCDVMMH